VNRKLSFSVSILSLIALVVVPLAVVLLGVGWRATRTLEQHVVQLRMAALDDAVTNWLTGGLRDVAGAGQTLAESTGFSPDAGRIADVERSRQLVALLGRYPVVSAAYAAYEDGHFVYAGRTSLLGPASRSELGAPADEAIIVRQIDGNGAERRETWWFSLDHGWVTSEQTRPTDYDPRTRRWFLRAQEGHTPTLTKPYQFAQSGVIGVTLATPIRGGGVIGFDFPLSLLSRLVSERRISRNSVILVASGAGVVLADSSACPLAEAGCLAGDRAMADAIRHEIDQLVIGHRDRIDQQIDFGGKAWKLLVDLMPSTIGERFIVGAAVPVVDINSESRALLATSGIAGILAVALAVLAAFGVSRVMSRSISGIAAKTERIRNLNFSDRQPVTSRIREIAQLSVSIERMREGLEIFGRYVSKDLVRQIMRTPQSSGVGGVRRDLTVMFSDIEGFSLLSEDMPPELLLSRLSRYFEAIGAPIAANRGTIDKFIGDSVMAFWNAPESEPDHVFHACRAAIAAAAAGGDLANKWQDRARPGFRTRFGLHTGPAVVGNVGSPDRINYTLVGAVANQASRLEGLNKMYGTEILASGEVARLTAARFVWRHIDRVVPAGTTEALDIYEPLGEGGDPSTHDVAAFLTRWDAARTAYGDGRFGAALAGFEEAAILKPEDGPCQTMIERCTWLARSDPPDGWDGTWHFERK
jgi:adenylate cyclase